jgi:hypothetical protein
MAGRVSGGRVADAKNQLTDPHEDFINEEGVAIASLAPLQSTSKNGSELDTPEANRLAADGDASFSHEIFDIPMAEVEAVIEPDSIGNYNWRKSVTFICVHASILPRPRSLLGNVGYRVLLANIEELLKNPTNEASWC